MVEVHIQCTHRYKVPDLNKKAESARIPIQTLYYYLFINSVSSVIVSFMVKQV